MDKAKASGVSYTLVVRESMNDNLRHAFDSVSGHDDDAGAVARGKIIFSAPVGSLNLASLSQTLDEPRTKRARAETASEKLATGLQDVEMSSAVEAVDSQNVTLK